MLRQSTATVCDDALPAVTPEEGAPAIVSHCQDSHLVAEQRIQYRIRKARDTHPTDAASYRRRGFGMLGDAGDGLLDGGHEGET